MFWVDILCSSKIQYTKPLPVQSSLRGDITRPNAWSKKKSQVYKQKDDNHREGLAFVWHQALVFVYDFDCDG